MTGREQTATSPLLRRLNAVTVLNVLRRSGALTGAELMDATGLSRPTVHTVCDQLIALGWVSELEGRRPANRTGTGRPARCYELNANAGCVIGMDLGANKVTAVLANLRGDALAETTRVFSGEHADAKERIATARRVITALLGAAGVPATALLTVAIGVAAPVDDQGRVIAKESYLPGMAATDVRARIGRGASWTVILENDANLAVVGERWRGVATGSENVVLLLAGERLGAGLFLGGRLIRGASGGAGEMAFLELVKEVGNTDAIGGMARALGRLRVLAADPSVPPSAGSLLALSRGDPDRVEAETVFEAARAGDPMALAVITGIADRMARVIAVFGTLLNPDLVVIGGAVAASADLLMEPIAGRLPDYTSTPPLVLATGLGDHGVVTGAIRLALDKVETTMLLDDVRDAAEA